VGETTWTGTPSSPGPVLDGSRWRSRIVGGAGKLGSEIDEKNYVGAVPWTRIVADILRECGEHAGSVVADGQAAYYERARGTAGQALAELCAAAGVTWWVSRDGLVCVAPARAATVVDEKNASRVAFDVDGTIVLNARHAADVLPGQTIDSRVIAALRWQLTPERLTVECGFQQSTFPDQRDRFYERTYSAKVDTQNGDGSINVIANGLFQMSKVPLLCGLPGASVLVKPGELVAVAFFGGKRDQPYALAVQQDRSAGQALALVGDTVEIVLPPFTFVGLENAVTPVTGVMTCVIPKTVGTIIGPGSGRTKSG
jgi:hypothetical protein